MLGYLLFSCSLQDDLLERFSEMGESDEDEAAAAEGVEH